MLLHISRFPFLFFFFLTELSIKFQRILRLCGGRKVLFNNKTEDKGKKAVQINQLLAHVADIKKQNYGLPYTDKLRRKIKVIKLFFWVYICIQSGLMSCMLCI